MLSPQEVAEKWIRNIGAAQQSVQKGVQAVTESPGAAAARAADTWQNRVSSADAKAKFVRNTSRLSLEDWRNAMLSKGIARMSSGATAARGKVESFMAEFLPFVNGVATRVRQMPKNTLEDRIQRMIAQVQGTSQFRRSS